MVVNTKEMFGFPSKLYQIRLAVQLCIKLAAVSPRSDLWRIAIRRIADREKTTTQMGGFTADAPLLDKPKG